MGCYQAQLWWGCRRQQQLILQGSGISHPPYKTLPNLLPDVRNLFSRGHTFLSTANDAWNANTSRSITDINRQHHIWSEKLTLSVEVLTEEGHCHAVCPPASQKPLLFLTPIKIRRAGRLNSHTEVQCKWHGNDLHLSKSLLYWGVLSFSSSRTGRAGPVFHSTCDPNQGFICQWPVWGVYTIHCFHQQWVIFAPAMDQDVVRPTSWQKFRNWLLSGCISLEGHTFILLYSNYFPSSSFEDCLPNPDLESCRKICYIFI